MTKILVSLISDQTIPNVLLIKELQDINRHIFITTQKMEDEKKSRSNWIIAATKLDPVQVQRIIVNQDSLNDIEEQLRAQVKEREVDFVVNLTGGNKLMSLATYNFFSRCPNNKIFYIPVKPKMITYEGIFPKEIRKEHELKYRVNLWEYLTAYGIVPKTSDFNKLLKDETETQNFYAAYRQLESEQLAIPNKLRKFRNKGVKITEIDGLKNCLETIKFSLKSEKLSKQEVKYLSGDWFEEYVYILN